MKKRIITLALFAVCLFAINSAQAAQLLFTPALVFSEEYTDNLFLDNENEKDDYITSTGLDLTGEMLWRTAGIVLTYKPTYKHYEEHDDLDEWRHEAGLSIHKDLMRNTRFEIRDTYLRTNDPSDESTTSDLGDEPVTPDIEVDRGRRGREEYETNFAEARLTHRFGADESIHIAYLHTTLREVDPLDPDDLDDRDTATPSIGIVFNFTQRWVLELDSSYASTDYKDEDIEDRSEYKGDIRLLHRFNRSLSGYVHYAHTMLEYDEDTAVEEDYTIYEPSIGFRYDFSDSGRIEIGVGYYVQDFETSDNDEGYSVTSEIHKTWRRPAGYFGITADSGYIIDDKGIEDKGLNIYYRAIFDAGYHFTSRLTGSVYGSYRFDDYPNDVPEREANTVLAGVGIDWEAFEWMAIRLSGDYSEVSSDIETEEYSETRALLTIRLAPSSPFKLN